MAGVPQVCVNYPEYQAINNRYDVALMIDDTEPATIVEAVNRLLYDDQLHEKLRQNCLIARKELNWLMEERKLVQFYNDIFSQRI
jgi:hypothetical protein